MVAAYEWSGYSRKLWRLGDRSVSDFRLICDCQLHRRRSGVRAVFVKGVSLVRRRAAALVVTGSLALVGTGLPMKAMTGSYPRSNPATQASVTSLPTAMMQSFTQAPPISLEALVDDAKRDFFETNVPYGHIIWEESKRHGLAPELVAAIVKTESNFRPALRSHRDARGLMQVLPDTGRIVGVENLADPVENLRAGTRYLKYLEKRFRGNTTMMLAAYNAGPTAVQRWGGIPPYEETQEYLRRVGRSRHSYEQRIAEHVERALGLAPLDEARN